MIAGGFFYRHRFAGDAGFVDGGQALTHHPIHRNPLARFDQHNFAYLNLGGGQSHNLAAAPDSGFFRVELHQAFDGLAAAPDSVILKHIAERKQEQQNRAFMPLVDGGGPQCSQHHQHIHIDTPFCQAFDGGLCTKEPSGQVGGDVKYQHQPARRPQPFRHYAEDDRQRGDGHQTRFQPALSQPDRFISARRVCLHIFALCLCDCIHGVHPSCITKVKQVLRFR